MKENDFDDRFYYPVTKGEREQVERLKQFSTDPYEILKVRNRLEEFRSDLNAYNLQKELKNKRESLPRFPQDVDKKRQEDKPVFIIEKYNFFKSLWLYLTRRSDFRVKYGKNRRIKHSFVSLLAHGCGFVLSEYVGIFVLDYILNWQDMFKPIFKSIYRQGWREEEGRLFLDVNEFNILCACERLVTDKGISEILFTPNNTYQIFYSANVFIHSYYQIIKTGIGEFLSSFKKAMDHLVKADYHYKDQAPPYEEIMESLISFFDSRVEKEFIVPLIEALRGETISHEQARREAEIIPIDTKEYRADPQLKILMQARENYYKSKIQKAIKTIEHEITLLRPIEEDLNYSYSYNHKELSAVQLAMELRKAKLKGKKHVIKELCEAINFFNDYYAPILTMRVPYRSRGGIEYIELFTKDVFTEEYSGIMTNQMELTAYFGDDFSDCIKSNPAEANKQLLECINLVSKICDLMFTIGEKLQKATDKRKTKKKSYKPLDRFTLEKMSIPCGDFKAYFHSRDKKLDAAFTLSGKLIKEIIDDVRRFCFDFLRYFEPPLRFYGQAGLKKKTLQARLNARKELMHVIAALKEGREIDLSQYTDLGL